MWTDVIQFFIFAVTILAALATHHHAAPPTHQTADVRDAIRIWGELAISGARALVLGELHDLGSTMNQAQQVYESYLADLPELRAPGLVAACRMARNLGALGAKFSGAGGDGSVVALLPDGETAVALKQRFEAEGLSTWALGGARKGDP